MGVERAGDTTWQLRIEPRVSTPGDFLFGGCGLGAAIVALEAASGRPTVWATAQYLSYAPLGSTMRIEVTVAVVGHRTTQARATGWVDDREILTVNAALGTDRSRPRRRLGDAADGARARPLSAAPPPGHHAQLDLRAHRDPRGRRPDLRAARRHHGRPRDRRCGAGSRATSSPRRRRSRSSATSSQAASRIPSADASWARAWTTRCAPSSSSRPSGCSATCACTPLVAGYGQGIAFLWSEQRHTPRHREPVGRRQGVAVVRAPSLSGATPTRLGASVRHDTIARKTSPPRT